MELHPVLWEAEGAGNKRVRERGEEPFLKREERTKAPNQFKTGGRRVVVESRRGKARSGLDRLSPSLSGFWESPVGRRRHSLPLLPPSVRFEF